MAPRLYHVIRLCADIFAENYAQKYIHIVMPYYDE